MRYKMIFSYDGSNFSGYQKQPQKRTIQKEIEDVLTKINNKAVLLTASGRTDTHVHAYGQTAHFDFNKQISVDKLKKAINSLLPSDIYVRELEEVSDQFHARFDVLKKTYCYKINTGIYDPVSRSYVYQLNRDLDFNLMIEASKILIGTHDFSSFVKLEEEKDCVRTIEDISITNDHNIVSITFTGNGFLRYMVRNLVGCLIEIGMKKRAVDTVRTILDSQDRTKAGLCAPAEGLYLMKVFYDGEERNK